MNMNRRKVTFIVLLFLSTTLILADIIILKNGGRIPASSWWYDGEELKYYGYGGIYGIAANEVEKIIPDDPKRSNENGDLRDDTDARASEVKHAEEIKELESRVSDLEAIARSTSIEGRMKIQLKIAEIYTKIGNDFFTKRSYENALGYYFKALNHRPDFQPAKINIASTYLHTGNHRDALPYVMEALSNDLDNALLYDVLGEIYYMMDDIDSAIIAWERSIELEENKMLDDKLERIRKERNISGDYQISNAKNFTLLYDGEKYARIGDDILAFLEENFDDLVQKFNHYPLSSISVIIYPESDFYAVTELPQWAGGVFDGKIRVPVKGLDALTVKAKRMLLHELAHAFIYSKTKGNCSKWLHEGIAQLVEGKSAPIHFTTRDRLEQITLSSLEEDFDYRISLSVVSYIEQTYSFHSILQILEELGKGGELKEALTLSTGLAAEEFMREWKNTIISKGIL